jgi:arabinosaccharide transport system substrate-binding protein
MANAMCRYIRMLNSPQPIAYPGEWGQEAAEALRQNTVLFYLCPDWLLKQLESDAPDLNGKLKVMPLPAFEKGGRRTSTWGGTGFAITRACKNKDLAWKLAMHLYFNKESMAEQFEKMRVLPVVPEVWKDKRLDKPDAFFSGQPLAREFANVASEVPPVYYNMFTELATSKMLEAFENVKAYYQENGEKDLERVARAQLRIKADDVRAAMAKYHDESEEDTRP